MKTYGENVTNSIIKTSDSQIQAFIPEYDMKIYKLKFSDFINKNRNAYDFIVDLLEQSFYECGFHKIPSNNRYSITTHIKNLKGVTIIITAKQNINFPKDTIITMKDWTSICDLPAEKFQYL